MILKLPVLQEGPLFGFSVELEGVNYGFTFRWNERSSQWSMDVADGDGNLLVAGIRVVVDVPMLLRYRSIPRLPPGDIVAVDSTDQSRDPDFEDLGRRVEVFYISSDEIG